LQLSDVVGVISSNNKRNTGRIFTRASTIFWRKKTPTITNPPKVVVEVSCAERSGALSAVEVSKYFLQQPVATTLHQLQYFYFNVPD